MSVVKYVGKIWCTAAAIKLNTKLLKHKANFVADDFHFGLDFHRHSIWQKISHECQSKSKRLIFFENIKHVKGECNLKTYCTTK